MNIVKQLLFLLFIRYSTSYIEFQLIRNPHITKRFQFLKSQCQDPKTVTDQTKYLELCYQKDISYALKVQRNGKKSLLALDLTSPISWIKDEDCKLLDTSQKCTSVLSSFGERVKNIFKQQINKIMNKLLSSKSEDDDDKAIIQGSNEIVMGEVNQLQNISIVGRNSDRLSKFFNVILLGLYIIGQNDNVTLKSTTFINAHKITPNLNNLCDGAISLRFDDNSQNSFLNQLFTYLQSKQKIISVYLGKSKQIVAIGGITSKYAENRYNSFNRIKIKQNQLYGKLPTMQGIIYDNGQDGEKTIQVESSVVFSLSSSYLGFSNSTISKIISKFFPSSLKCTINNNSYIECLDKNKDLKQVLSNRLDIDFDTSMVHFPIADLVRSHEKGKIVFNIKQTFTNFTIIGQPFFNQYFAFFDYNKNEIGFTQRKLSPEQHMIQAVTLIHFVVIVLLLGICFVLTSQPCKKIYYRIFMKAMERSSQTVKNAFKKYQPIVDQNYQQPNHNKRVPQLQDVEGI